MITPQQTSVFESYNARALRPSQVAKTFVPSKSFEMLAQRRHSVVLGPRGSGKTTLLKMLQPAALESWEHELANDYCERIDFTGVFVPFDRSWRAQLDNLAATVPTEHQLGLGRAAFTTHTFRALNTAFQNRISPYRDANVRELRRVQLTPKEQAELARLLYTAWRLPDGPRSLLGVKMALGNRLASIGSYGYRPGVDSDAVLKLTDDALFLPFLAGISGALDAWESVVGGSDELWALLFDELELAPVELKREIFSAIRSSDSRLLFKLALSPFDAEVPFEGGPLDPQRGEDYDAIPLWYSLKRHALDFCEDLWKAMLIDLDIPQTDPTIAFGRSKFETDDSQWRSSVSGTAYGVGSKSYKYFVELQSRDPSFAAYLQKKGYRADMLDLIPPASRAADVRKIAPLVQARLFFRRTAAIGAAHAAPRQGRKRLTLYTGWETLSAVTEGNPRWFIGIVKQLLDRAPKGKVRISSALQARAIESAGDRYRAALRTIPVTSAFARAQADGLLSILETIGSFFRVAQITDSFTPEPPGSFTVDTDTSPAVLDALAQALNTGAIVIVDESEDATGLEDMRGRRFRLCYLLIAHFEAMPRLGRPVSLKRILSEQAVEATSALELGLE